MCSLNNRPICQGRTTLAHIICTVTVVLSRSVWKLGVNKLQKIKNKKKNKKNQLKKKNQKTQNSRSVSTIK